MINPLILAAFLAGCGLALTLETWLLFRSQRGRWRPSLFGMLALLSFICAAWVTQIPTQSTGAQTPVSLSVVTAVPTSTTISPLPKPHVQTLSRQTEPVRDTAVVPSNSAPQPIRLQIPALAVDEAIQPVPVRNGRWDVSNLGGQVGLLASTGQTPRDALAMVFAGHMTFPNANLLETGAFAELQYATYGTEIVVQTGADKLVYEVSEIQRLPPGNVDALYLEDSNSILLITCTDWAEQEGLYAKRLLVRAQVVSPARPDKFTKGTQ